MSIHTVSFRFLAYEVVRHLSRMLQLNFSVLYCLLLLGLAKSAELISEHECVYDTTPATQEQCKQQDLKAERYMPSNESIYKIFKPYYDLDKKYYVESIYNHHVDLRYVKSGPEESFDERRKILINLFHEWTNFAEERDLKYWIVHGTLIGWHWQNSVLPWDLDIDIQVLSTDLLFFYVHFKDYLFKGRYLFDLNPHAVFREHQNHNIIDARFVDTETGYYIDMTGVAFDGTYLHCKSPHHYLPQWIFPLKRSTFCGVTTWVPNNVAATLFSEYDFGVLDNTYYEFHVHRKRNYYGWTFISRPIPYEYSHDAKGWVKVNPDEKVSSIPLLCKDNSCRETYRL